MQLLSSISQIEQIDEILAHRFGPYFLINISICVNGSISVEEGDRIATQAEDTIMKNIDYVRQVHVHFHPSSSNEKIFPIQ